MNGSSTIPLERPVQGESRLDVPDNATLWGRFKRSRDEHARAEIIVRYAPLVKYVVGRMAISMKGLLDPEDVLAHGTVGLIDAVDRYDPTVGVKFETYAIRRIRGAILDTIRKLNLQPRSVGRKSREIEAAYAALQDRLHRLPTEAEVAEYLRITPDELDAALVDMNCQIVSVESSYAVGDDGQPVALLDLIEDPMAPSPAGLLDRAETLEALTAGLRRLPDRDRLVLSLYYHEELTLKEIARILRVSESRVSQLHASAILKLRAWMRSTLDVAAE